MKVSTERSPCLTVTHSRWRGDFSSFAVAQSWAEAKGTAKRARMINSGSLFMVHLDERRAREMLPERENWPQEAGRSGQEARIWHLRFRRTIQTRSGIRASPRDRTLRRERFRG